jgi:hypothetical protein
VLWQDKERVRVAQPGAYMVNLSSSSPAINDADPADDPALDKDGNAQRAPR